MRLSALFAMAISAVALGVEEQENAQLSVQEEEQLKQAAIAESMGMQLVEMEEAANPPKDVFTIILLATLGGDDVTQEIQAAYHKGQRTFYASKNLQAPAAKGASLDIMYTWNKKFINEEGSKVTLKNGEQINYDPDAYKPAPAPAPKPKPVPPKPKPAPAPTPKPKPPAPKPKPQPKPKPSPPSDWGTEQKIVGAWQSRPSQTHVYGSVLEALSREPRDHFRYKSCTLTNKGSGNWVNAMISEHREITAIQVLNRRQYGDRLWGATVFAGWQPCGTFTNVKGWSTFVCPRGTHADRVTVVQPRNTYLTICGLQIFGK